VKSDVFRVLKTLRVADDFHSRYLARQRTYIYRVCVARQLNLDWALPYPPYERERSWLIPLVVVVSFVLSHYIVY